MRIINSEFAICLHDTNQASLLARYRAHIWSAFIYNKTTELVSCNSKTIRTALTDLISPYIFWFPGFCVYKSPLNPCPSKDNKKVGHNLSLHPIFSPGSWPSHDPTSFLGHLRLPLIRPFSILGAEQRTTIPISSSRTKNIGTFLSLPMGLIYSYWYRTAPSQCCH